MATAEVTITFETTLYEAWSLALRLQAFATGGGLSANVSPTVTLKLEGRF